MSPAQLDLGLGGTARRRDTRPARRPVAAPSGLRGLPAPVPPPAAAPSSWPVAHGGGATLDRVVIGAWEGLLAHGSVGCPVCRGAMTPRYGAGPAPVGGRCRDCSAELS